MMKRYRAAVIGLGFIGPLHLDALSRVPEAQIAAVCDRDRALTDQYAALYGVKGYDSWRELVVDPGIDVVHNCLPVALHDEVNEAVLKAGKRLYCEKPLSLTAEGAARVARLADEKGLRCGLNHQYRMNAAVQEMRSRVRAGLPGRILAVNGCYLQESASRGDDWSSRMENTGPTRAIGDIGTHWADTAVSVLGQPIKAVFASLHTHFPERTDAEGKVHTVETEDSAFILVRFADGTPGQLTVSKAANGHKNDLRLDVWGENYSMAWAQEEPDRLTVGLKGVGFETVYMNPKTCREDVRPYITAPMGHVMGWPDALRNAVRAYYRSLGDSISEVPYATLWDGVDRLRFAEACVASDRLGRWVEVQKA